ncbi:MAG: hypothetical protein LQ346_000913 [Caloplaca aetnensis]|nr:MAG: hypothetical protein LQ346_000913 [Caloplaca aetnensis]
MLKFLEYEQEDDFVGMDMCRKFIQMGMKSAGHKGRGEKAEASRVFSEVWQSCKAHEGYRIKKEAFLKEQKEWERERKRGVKGDQDE